MAISTKTGFPEIPSARILLALAASTVNLTLAKVNLNITHQNALEFRVLQNVSSLQFINSDCFNDHNLRSKFLKN